MTTTGDTADEAFAAAMRALRDLVSSGGWTRTRVTTTLDYVRPWPDGSVDTLTMTTESHAVAERTDPLQRPVWRMTGPAPDVIAALRALPAPGDAGAPTPPLQAPSPDRAAVTTPNEPLSDTAYQALATLLTPGHWTRMPETAGMRVFIRPWPDETVDSLVIITESLAYAARMNPADLPVWQHKGTLIEVIAALQALPSPDAPNAPCTVIQNFHARSWRPE